MRGPMGFGRSSHLHTTKILRLSQDLPIVIEIIDAEEKIDAFVPKLEDLMGSGIGAMGPVKVRRYGDGGSCCVVSASSTGYDARRSVSGGAA